MLEACCVSAAQAVAAKEGGAGRIELCREIQTGGLTPSAAEIIRTVAVGLPVNVLVRTREGDFVFDDAEVERMVGEIEMCRECGASGIVIGCLDSGGDVDMAKMRRMMAAARGDGGIGGKRRLSVTFHRAFDCARDPFKALENIIELGCDRILTSGQKASAVDGMDLLAQLVEKAAGRIIIMPGAGIRPENLELIRKTTGAVEFHGTSICRKN